METREDKFVCPHCGKEHKEKVFNSRDEVIDHVATGITEELFEGLWTDLKKEFKEMSKREIAKETFFQGAVQVLHNFLPERPEVPRAPKEAQEE